jgi:hypothetical protein
MTNEEPITFTNTHMVVCKLCGLLVGWTDKEPSTFVCIPCFDQVIIVRES